MFVDCLTCLWLERRKECEGVNILSTVHSGLLFSFCSNEMGKCCWVHSPKRKQKTPVGKAGAFPRRSFQLFLTSNYKILFQEKNFLLRKLFLSTVLNLCCHFWKISFWVSYLLGKTQHSSINLKTIYQLSWIFWKSFSEFSEKKIKSWSNSFILDK